jgi:hypothetical protein
MQDALRRLKELQRQLESLRRTTEDVIAESQRLIDAIHLSPPPQSGPTPARALKPSRRPRKHR